MMDISHSIARICNVPNLLQNLRNSKRTRLILIGILIVIAVIIAIFFKKVRLFMIGVIVLLLVAFGLEFKNTDYDLGKMMQTDH